MLVHLLVPLLAPAAVLLTATLAAAQAPPPTPKLEPVVVETNVLPLERTRTEEQAREEIERTPLRRVAEAADQANVICFLASADADFVTGITIDVTGGV